MCFVHKHMQNADFGQNVMWPRDRWSDFRKLGIKRCIRLERKNSWKGVSRSAAVARQSRISYRGVKLTPPPPQLLKIGLNTIVRYRFNNEMTRYQVPREETSINLTNISEQVYSVSKAGIHFAYMLFVARSDNVQNSSQWNSYLVFL